MSVLKSKRTVSKAEYVNTANNIYIETISFLTRLSARYSRLIAADTAKLAGQVLDHAEEANSILPTDELRYGLRKTHLLEARAALNALDVRLTHIYLILCQNPQGCFERSGGKPVPAADAIKKLDSMAETLGVKIDNERALLGAVMDSDKKSLKRRLTKKKPES